MNPGFFKRLLVVVYDALLLVGVLFLAAMLIPLIPDEIEFSLAGKLIKSGYLLFISFLFYGWFWTHGGQTLGMKVWDLYLVKADGKFINWKIAVIRYISAWLSWAAVGLGFTWILLNKRNQAWHDILSGSQIVYYTKHKSTNQKLKKIP